MWKNVYFSFFILFCASTPTRKRIPTFPMPIVGIQAVDRGSSTDFVWFISRFQSHTGAIFSAFEYSELNVTEGGRVSFFNNQCLNDGGKYCHLSMPCPPLDRLLYLGAQFDLLVLVAPKR